MAQWIEREFDEMLPLEDGLYLTRGYICEIDTKHFIVTLTEKTPDSLIKRAHSMYGTNLKFGKIVPFTNTCGCKCETITDMKKILEILDREWTF